jgi:ATP synthase protein I
MALFGPEQQKQLRSANRVMAVGSELGIATLIGLFGGSWLDRRFGTGPWFTLLGIALGLAAGIKSLMRLAPRPQKKTEQPPDRRDG